MTPTESVNSKYIDKLGSPGNYNSDNKFPENYIEGNIEFAKNIRRNKTFWQLSQFILEQQALAVTNPYDGNIINPVIITGQLPGEGIIPISIDGVFPTYVSKTVEIENIDNDKTKRELSALNSNILGQENASQFSLKGIGTPGELAEKAVRAIIPSLFHDNFTDSDTNPKTKTFEQRLGMNTLNPGNTETLKDIYHTIYSSTGVSNVEMSKLEEYYAPIDSGEGTKSRKLVDDENYVGNEQAFISNSPHENSASTLDFEKENVEPDILSNGIAFPFYFKSLNSFRRFPEKIISFQATMNGIKEQYKPNWNSKKYFGRNTPIYIYENTDRSIGFNFTIFANKRQNLILVKQRVNWLARHTYPSYINLGKNSKVLYEAPIVELTIGDLFKNLAGVITDLTLDWDNGGDSRWELSKNMIMPQLITVSLSFTVLTHKFMQNAGISTSNKFESSDFYEFIKPQNRGILNEENNRNFVDYTPSQANRVATQKTK